MDDDTLTDEGSGEDDTLSDTIAAALEDQEGESLISELGAAQDAAGETQETDGEALPDDDGGAETPGGTGSKRISSKIKDFPTLPTLADISTGPLLVFIIRLNG